MLKKDLRDEYYNPYARSECKVLRISDYFIARTCQHNGDIFFYDVNSGDIVKGKSTESLPENLIKFCVFDIYEFTIDFFRRKNISDEIAAKYCELHPQKYSDYSQTYRFLENFTLSVQKVQRSISNCSKKTGTAVRHGVALLSDLWARECRYYAKKAIAAWCVENSIRFISDEILPEFENISFDGNITEMFECMLCRNNDNSLKGKITYIPLFKPDYIVFKGARLQKKTSASWATYLVLKKPENQSSMFFENYYFDNLPVGTYRIKAEFTVGIQTSSMKICEENGCFFSENITVGCKPNLGCKSACDNNAVSVGNGESRYYSAGRYNCLEMGNNTLQSMNPKGKSYYSYDTVENEVKYVSEGEAKKAGLVKYCSFDSYKFTHEFICKHNLPMNLIDEFERLYPQKDANDTQSYIFLEELELSVPKITKYIGAYTDAVKQKNEIGEGVFSVADLWEREFNRAAKDTVLKWCVENSVRFVLSDCLPEFEDVSFDGNLTEHFVCNLRKENGDFLSGEICYIPLLDLDYVVFSKIELQKKASHKWVKYCEIYSPVKKRYNSDSYYGSYSFFGLPKGTYMLKVEFTAGVQGNDMKIYEQEGLFYSKEIEVN